MKIYGSSSIDAQEMKWEIAVHRKTNRPEHQFKALVNSYLEQ